MEYNFTQGQKLIIELASTEIIEGEYLSGGKERIELINIVLYPYLQNVRGPYSYYRCEISSIHVLNESNDLNDFDTGSDETTNVVKNCNNVNIITNKIRLSQAEYVRLKSLSQNYIYMSTMDSNYYTATDYINNCENIGIIGITNSACKMAKLCLLVISTWDQVYIFDILAFNQMKFPVELKTVLESEMIKKVIHDSRLLVDLMNCCYKIKVVNIFDTQIADVMIRKRNAGGILPEQVRNISECLVHYFNFPMMLLDRAQKTEPKKWEARPLSTSRKYRAAQLATYLITLKNDLEMLLLQDFYKAVDVYSKSLDSFTVLQSHRCLVSQKLPDLLNKLDLSEGK